MDFRSIHDLNQTLVRVSEHAKQFDVIVGVPRSGLMAANLLSLITNKALAELDGFIEGRLLAAGKTKTGGRIVRSIDEVKNVLLLDDSIAHGRAMAEARAKLKPLSNKFNITYAAVYGEKSHHSETDVIYEVVRQPRLFQWNLMHHRMLADACVDIDGVLCPDPTREENDDGPNYEHFLLNAPVLHYPTKRIGHLVTNRLERFRPHTEAWLARNGIEYERLEMHPADTVEERRAQPIGKFKTDVFRTLSSPIFIESDARQADAIAIGTNKPVICIETWAMHQADSVGAFARSELSSARYRVASFPSRTRSAARRLLRSAMGDTSYNRLKSLVKH